MAFDVLIMKNKVCLKWVPGGEDIMRPFKVAMFRAEPDTKALSLACPTLPGQERTHRLSGQSSPGDLFLYRLHPCSPLTL